LSDAGVDLPPIVGVRRSCLHSRSHRPL